MGLTSLWIFLMFIRLIFVVHVLLLNLYDTKASIDVMTKRRENAAAINALWAIHKDKHCRTCGIHDKQAEHIGVGLKGRLKKRTINSESLLPSSISDHSQV